MTGLASGVLALAATTPYISRRPAGDPAERRSRGPGGGCSARSCSPRRCSPSRRGRRRCRGARSSTAASSSCSPCAPAARGWALLDVVCGVLGVAAIVAWQVTAQPDAALAIAIAGDMVLCIPTIAKTLRDPRSEMWSRFLAAVRHQPARRRLGVAPGLPQPRLAGLPRRVQRRDRGARPAPGSAPGRRSADAASGSPARAAGCAGSASARACWRRSRAGRAASACR